MAKRKGNSSQCGLTIKAALATDENGVVLPTVGIKDPRTISDPEAYRAYNRAKMKRRRERNRDKVNAQVRKYAQQRRERDPEGHRAMLDRASASDRARRRDNPGSTREKDRAKYRRHYETRPEIRQAQTQRRIALRHSAPGRGVTTEQWEQVLSESLGLCAYCNRLSDRLEMDHIEPLSRGGAHDIDNITAVCKPCNCSKNKKPLLIWLARRAADRC